MNNNNSTEDTKEISPVYFMGKALRLANKAASLGETPIGAVIVKNGVIIARGYNMREKKQDVTLHAEMIAIRKACKKLKSWRLDGCDIYVTLEPCIMCAGAIQQSKIRKVYFAVAEPKGGAVISKAQVLDISLNHVVEYESGILKNESASLIASFFTDMRKKDRQTGLTKGQRRNDNKKT